MGAKQSKRSVDISGKEAEGGGEVAAAGAGGEGRVEALAEPDALKPQQNGDAHIQPPEELTEKEKQLDSGTPENEKDATTEKENKGENEKDIVLEPVTNGDSESKPENGDTNAVEENKKPKKEKVKKKWSLRSISFSRKEKPKQEKKPKDEESKTNGEPEKVPEEAAESPSEVADNKVLEEAQAGTESQEEKPTEVPVASPLSNGTSSPEPVGTPATEPVGTPASDPATSPDSLPVADLAITDSVKPEPVPAVPVEEKKSPVPEIPTEPEVCVDQKPPVEPSPPPLPANPPPSSVASFAATTMAPELAHEPPAPSTNATDATELTLNTKESEPQNSVQGDTETLIKIEQVTELDKSATVETSLVKTVQDEIKSAISDKKDHESLQSEKVTDEVSVSKAEDVLKVSEEIKNDLISTLSEPSQEAQQNELENGILSEPDVKIDNIPEIECDPKIPEQVSVPDSDCTKSVVEPVGAIDISKLSDIPAPESFPENESVTEISESIEDLPPPPPEEEVSENVDINNSEATKQTSADHIEKVTLNGIDNESSLNLKEMSETEPAVPACNGSPAPDLTECLQQVQDQVSEKIADLIPETTPVDEMITETETSSDVVLAN